MTGKSGTTWWRRQIPTAVVVLLIAALAVWAFATGTSAAAGVGRGSPARELALLGGIDPRRETLGAEAQSS